MMERIAEASPRSLARMAGVSQLLEALTATFGQVFVLGRFVVSGNAAATAANILGHEGLFRLGFASSPIGMLVIKSRFLPRVIGILLIAASFAGLAYSFGLIVMPDRRQIITLLTMPIDSIGELSLAIWLLIRGARVPQTSHAVSAV